MQPLRESDAMPREITVAHDPENPNGLEWWAFYGDFDAWKNGDPIGYGPTEIDAIADLQEWDDENDGDRSEPDAN